MNSQFFRLIVGVGVGEGVGELVGELVGEGVGELVGEGVGELVGEGVGELVGRDFLMAIPLFHTNFLPDLTHVYLIPEDVLV